MFAIALKHARQAAPGAERALCQWHLPLVLIAALFAATAYGATATGLYEAEVPVPDRGDGAREVAQPRALDAVLVKLTGRADVTARDLTGATAAQIAALVEQSQWREGDTGTTLWVRFDADAVDELLGAAGVSTWPKTRPRTVLLMAIDAGGPRRVLGADGEAGGLAAQFRRAARARGLPIALPLMDLRDQRSLNPADVWGGFRKQLDETASRYRAEAVVHGRLTAVAGTVPRWDASWTLSMGAREGSWNRAGLSSEDLARAVVGSVVDELVDVFATTATETLPAGSGFRFLVRDISRADDYGEVMRYLRSIDVIDSVSVLEARIDGIVFSVEAQAGENAIRRLLELGSVLAFSQEGELPEFRLRLR